MMPWLCGCEFQDGTQQPLQNDSKIQAKAFQQEEVEIFYTRKTSTLNVVKYRCVVSCCVVSPTPSSISLALPSILSVFHSPPTKALPNHLSWSVCTITDWSAQNPPLPKMSETPQSVMRAASLPRAGLPALSERSRSLTLLRQRSFSFPHGIVDLAKRGFSVTEVRSLRRINPLRLV